ncbi:DUF2057 domain-containing protein [Aeromonas salmonicida]|uniref:DUF2057 domain-containing protein n=1 Tax=Aeromonas salmonicida TaxID=645 RepID=UPI000B4053A0|nr:DUF2057 domain-containing protein [Aeromonas salmonicida]ARW83503.1 putative secreted protein [Aeromonas salmonicida]MUG28440.1 DUF2057 domain-containing protein [Aeromonas salmonicida]
MKSYQKWGGLTLLWSALGMSTAQAAVEVVVPPDFQILAVSAGKLQDEQHATLADGEQQLLVRYEGVIPSRNSSENDRQVRSYPQVVRYQASNQRLTLVAQQPADEQAMVAYAKAPVVTLQANGQALATQQDVLMTSGMLIGMDWRARLEEYNRSGGKAALTMAGAATTVVAGKAVPAVATSELEGRLQQLFMQADPELRKRFVGWAVPRL